VWIDAGAAGTIDAVAVLPFVSAGTDSSAEFLSDGITEALIDKLSQLPKLKVIARGSVFQFKGRHVDPKDAGHELQVRAVLTGEVSERNGQAVITVELVDTRDARHLWGQRYYRPMAELQAMQ